MPNKNNNRGTLKAIFIYAAVIILDIILVPKLAANRTDSTSIIIFTAIVDFLVIYFAGLIFQAPVFGKKTKSWYKTSGKSSDVTKSIDAKILSGYYGYSEGESRLIVEQQETNKLLEEQNRLLREKDK